MNRLIDLPPKSLQYMLDDDILMIDIRREEEWIETGIIKNVHTITFFDEYGHHDTLGFLKQLNTLLKNKEQTIVLICAHANRTRVVGNYLLYEQNYKNVTHLSGGMALWIEEGKETIEYKRNKL